MTWNMDKKSRNASLWIIVANRAAFHLTLLMSYLRLSMMFLITSPQTHIKVGSLIGKEVLTI